MTNDQLVSVASHLIANAVRAHMPDWENAIGLTAGEWGDVADCVDHLVDMLAAGGTAGGVFLAQRESEQEARLDDGDYEACEALQHTHPSGTRAI